MKAPIALFCYNRPAELTQTINSIKRNKESAHSDIYIFSDGPKNSDDAKRVREVRDIIGAIEGFNTVNITFREQNIGLAENIIDGVNNVLSVHDRVIVIEDDLKVSNHFLCFMNEALERYKSASRVWHISGWNYPIDSDKLPDIFLWRVMNCWGWATWSNRWQHFNKDPQQVIDDFTHKDIYEFNVDGRQDFFGQIIDNSQGQINTWAIFWYATIFQNNGLCLNPAQTLVDNIGFSSGTHCNNKSFKDLLPVKPPSVWPEELKESDEHLLEIKKYFESVGPALPLELSSFNLTEAEISSLYPLLSRQNFSLRSSLEQIWYLMDSVWDNLELDNENLDLEKLQEFYMHPVWLLNGLYTETDNESIAHRKKLSNWVRSKPEIQKIVDVGGGIGFLARTIASDTPTSEIKILEPFPSNYAARVIENRKSIEFISKLYGTYDCIILMDVLEHVEDPLLMIHSLENNLNENGYLVTGNCFKPVIKCHLPCTFHLEYSFSEVIGALGYELIGEISGTHIEIFRKIRKSNIDSARNKEQLSKVIYNNLKKIGTSQNLVNSSLQLNSALSKFYRQLDESIDFQKNYIIYGAGTGARLLVESLGNKIIALVDKDPNTWNGIKFGKPVSSPDLLKNYEGDIIISVFGREDSISEYLKNTYQISPERIINVMK